MTGLIKAMLSRSRAILPAPSVLMKRPSGWIHSTSEPGTTWAFLLREQGRYDEALSAFDRAVEINPQYAMAWNNRGTTLASLGRYDEAILAYDRAIELNPQDPDSWYNKGVALNLLNRTVEADVALARAGELDLTGES